METENITTMSFFTRINKLFNACKTGDVAMVKSLISHGDKEVLNYFSEHGTPLGVATLKGHVDVVKALLEAGADTDMFETTVCMEYNSLEVWYRGDCYNNRYLQCFDSDQCRCLALSSPFKTEHDEIFRLLQ